MYRPRSASCRLGARSASSCTRTFRPATSNRSFAGLGRRKTAAGRARPERRCCEPLAPRSSCSPRPAGWPRKAGCDWPFWIAATGTWLSATACSARACSIRSRSATTRPSRQFSPGHLLQYHLLQALHADPQVTAVDYIGEMTEYHAHWRPEAYPFARLAFARPNSVLGRAALWGYRRIKGPSEGLPEIAAGRVLSCHL